MAIIIKAPKEYSGKKPSLFLGGGISHCEDWQHQVVSALDVEVQTKYARSEIKIVYSLNDLVKLYRLSL